jgi:hypothetical protein
LWNCAILVAELKDLPSACGMDNSKSRFFGSDARVSTQNDNEWQRQ